MTKRKSQPPELYPGHRRDLKKQQRRRSKIAEANAEPFPGPLADAFAGAPIKLDGFSVREFVPRDVAILKRLNSPFYRQILEALKPREKRKPTDVADADEWEVIYLFTRPCAEAEAKLNEGRAAYTQAARAAFADNPRINIALYNDLYLVCAGRIVAAFRTAVAYQSRDSGDGTVFTPPPAAPMTASAGG